jgi:DNA-binding NarL/FixJ family response regulator
MTDVFPGKRLRVLIVADYPLFRRELLSLLAEMTGFDVVGEAQ